MSVDHSRDVTLSDMFAQHSVRKTHFCYATSLQGFGYGDVVHQFEKRCKFFKCTKAYLILGLFLFLLHYYLIKSMLFILLVLCSDLTCMAYINSKLHNYEKTLDKLLGVSVNIMDIEC